MYITDIKQIALVIAIAGASVNLWAMELGSITYYSSDGFESYEGRSKNGKVTTRVMYYPQAPTDWQYSADMYMENLREKAAGLSPTPLWTAPNQVKARTEFENLKALYALQESTKKSSKEALSRVPEVKEVEKPEAVTVEIEDLYS